MVLEEREGRWFALTQRSRVILYRKGETSTDSGYVYRTDSSDIGPNGVRYLGTCFEIP